MLKTFISVGNYDYYLKNSPKGLTTLQKSDISIEGDKIIFDFRKRLGLTNKSKKNFFRGIS